MSLRAHQIIIVVIKNSKRQIRANVKTTFKRSVPRKNKAKPQARTELRLIIINNLSACRSMETFILIIIILSMLCQAIHITNNNQMITVSLSECTRKTQMIEKREQQNWTA